MVDNELRSIIYFYLCAITFITKAIYFQLSIKRYPRPQSMNVHWCISETNTHIPIRYSTAIVQLLKGNLTVGKHFVRGYRFQ